MPFHEGVSCGPITKLLAPIHGPPSVDKEALNMAPLLFLDRLILKMIRITIDS